MVGGKGGRGRRRIIQVVRRIEGMGESLFKEIEIDGFELKKVIHLNFDVFHRAGNEDLHGVLYEVRDGFLGEEIRKPCRRKRNAELDGNIFRFAFISRGKNGEILLFRVELSGKAVKLASE